MQINPPLIHSHPALSNAQIGQAIEQLMLKYQLPKDPKDEKREDDKNDEIEVDEYPPVFFYRGRMTPESGKGGTRSKREYKVGLIPHILRWG